MPNKQFLIPTESAPSSGGGGGGSTGSVLLESSVTSTKISALPAGGPAQATDLIPIARGSNNDSLSVANILAAPLGTPILVAHTLSENAGSSPASITSSAINTTGSTLLVAAMYSFSTVTSPTITDSKSNSWATLTQFGRNEADGTITVFYCASPSSVGTGHTFTVSGTGATYVGVSVATFSGITTPRVTIAGQVNAANASTVGLPELSGPTGSILYATLVIGNGTGTVSIDNSFTILDQLASSMLLAHAWVTTADSGSYAPTWTTASATFNSAGSHTLFVI